MSGFLQNPMLISGNYFIKVAGYDESGYSHEFCNFNNIRDTMLNLYQALKSYPPFSRQLVCKGMLFTNYDCPQLESKMQLFVEHSFILFVISGRRIYHSHGQSWELKEGNCAFVKAGGLIAERPNDEEWCVMVFFVPTDFLLNTIKENRNLFPDKSVSAVKSNDPLIMLRASEISQGCFFSMLPYFAQNPPPPENLVELKFKELVLSLLVNSTNTNLLSYLHGLNSDQLSLQQVMYSNFSFHFSLEDYAKLSCKSVSSFKREFKKHFNDSPARWLMQKRLEKAKHLLEESQLAVADISFECGFENPNHFSRVFKEKTGTSPLQFRQKTKIALS